MTVWIWNNREANCIQFQTTKDFTRFDTVLENVIIYHEDNRTFVYLTKYCKKDVLPLIRDLDMAQEVFAQPSDLQYMCDMMRKKGTDMEK